MSKGNSVVQFVVKDDLGNVDVDASVANFEGCLNKYVGKTSALGEVIHKSVHAVFDKYPECNFNVDALISFTLREIDVEIVKENLEILQDEIGKFLRRSVEFKIVKGRNGGVKRV